MPGLLHAVQTIAGKLPYRDPADKETVRRLLSERTDLEDSNDEGWTAFMWAVRCQLDDITQLLADAGADTSRRHDAELILAAGSKDGALARHALTHGADVEFKSTGGWSPLETAAFNGSAEVVEALILAGASVPRDSLSILGIMDITDHIIDPIELELVYARVIELLLAHGATPHVIAYDGGPLIDTFPAYHYPTIHRVLSTAIAASPPPTA